LGDLFGFIGGAFTAASVSRMARRGRYTVNPGSKPYTIRKAAKLLGFISDRSLSERLNGQPGSQLDGHLTDRPPRL
jgi:hypothetical protein